MPSRGAAASRRLEKRIRRLRKELLADIEAMVASMS